MSFEEHSLCDFINADGPNMFEILRIPTTFSGKPVKEWEEDDGYSFGRDVIGTLRVCNDSAERGVKLVADFLHLAKKEKTCKIVCKWWKRTEEKCPIFVNALWRLNISICVCSMLSVPVLVM